MKKQSKIIRPLEILVVEDYPGNLIEGVFKIQVYVPGIEDYDDINYCHDLAREKGYVKNKEILTKRNYVFENEEIKAKIALTIDDAIEFLKEKKWDGIILDLGVYPIDKELKDELMLFVSGIMTKWDYSQCLDNIKYGAGGPFIASKINEEFIPPNTKTPLLFYTGDVHHSLTGIRLLTKQGYLSGRATRLTNVLRLPESRFRKLKREYVDKTKEKYRVNDELYFLDNKLFIGEKSEENWKFVIGYMKDYIMKQCRTSNK